MKRTPVAYADVPPLLIKAVLATEDEHFFEHPGIDYRGVIRGFISRAASGTRGRRQHDHAAGSAHARRDEASGIELGLRPVRREIQGVDPRVSHGAGVHEGRDSRALFEYELLRPALVWRRDRRADLFRQVARRADGFGDRDPRRHSAAADRVESRVRARSARRPGAAYVLRRMQRDARDQRRGVPGGARRAHRRQGVRSADGSSRRPTSPRWSEPRWFGASATRRRRPGSR